MRFGLMKHILICYFMVLSFEVAQASNPMEALTNYNVVLVHGAAPSSSGFENKCDEFVKSAWNIYNDHRQHTKDSSWNLGGAAGMLGAYNDRGNSKLTYWLDSAIFENYSTIWIHTDPIDRFFVDSLGNEIWYTSEELSHLESNR